MMSRSLNVPGSPSSVLQTTYFAPGKERGIKLHFNPVGKPAPPRPRKPEVFTSSITSFWEIFSTKILRKAL